MVKAARGLSVGTMCPAPWGAQLYEIRIPSTYHASPLVHPKTFTPLFTLKACPDVPVVTQKNKSQRVKKGGPTAVPPASAAPH